MTVTAGEQVQQKLLYSEIKEKKEQKKYFSLHILHN